MNIFTNIWTKIREVFGRLIPYRNIEAVERIDTPLSDEMINALNDWYKLYLDKATWVDNDKVKSMNLPAFVSSEIARQVVLEMQWNITGKNADGKTTDDAGNDVMNPRAEYLKAEFEKLTKILRQKLEQGCAAGGMIIKPYPNLDDGHIYFDWTMDWAFYPLAFDDDGNLSDVVIPDSFSVGKTTYTRLERHTVTKEGIKITQRAFKSEIKDSLGVEIPLSKVEKWASLAPEALVKDTDGQLFGWFKVASANNVDVDSPLGASVFSKAINVIKQADIQYSRLLWEFEGSELAIDVDPTVLRPKKTQGGGMETPKLNERLFRAVDADKGDRDLYEVFSPSIRDTNIINGLNQLLIRVEDLCGLSRGTLSDTNVDARTATELRINKERSFGTISDNQTALENCLKDVVRVMDIYATTYNLAPEGKYDVSFEWGDSILVDTNQQTQERLLLANNGMYGKVEMRMWYFGETRAQAQAAIEAIEEERRRGMEEMLPSLHGHEENEGNDDKPPAKEFS